MTGELQRELAERFHSMHEGNSMILMPYAWNGGSARIFEREGFPAVCTTSAGIAYSMGYPDGERVSVEDVIRITREISRVVKIPVSVDMERGYGSTPEEIRESLRRVVEAGAVGINIEDGYPGEKPHLEDLDKQLEKLKVINKLREEMGIPFFINARTCVYWLGIGDENYRMEEAVRRGNAFLQAGGDCVFIPGRIGAETAEKLVEEIEGPVNLIVNPDLGGIEDIEKAGVKRLCMGSGSVRIALKEVIDSAFCFRRGDMAGMLQGEFSYDRANDYFENDREERLQDNQGKELI